jgi:DNA-binding NarL/FixJ family response regulator
LKDGPERHLLEAMSYVRDGGQYISPLLKGARLFTKANANSPEDLATERRREAEVSYFLMGMRVKDIANWLRFWRRRR